ncbi:MAG: hypothetical protein MJZ76_02400, partial [Bacteroidales bacterium]|nr:hypothetical protein [Bacteroidales bacterium]
SWSWFGSGYASRFITQHIVANCGHLEVLCVDNLNNTLSDNSLRKAVAYLDKELLKEYEDLQKHNSLKDFVPGALTLHYMYARSFYLKKFAISAQNKVACDYFVSQAKKAWQQQSIYWQAMSAMAFYRMGDEKLAITIANKLKDRALYSDEMGMYWKKEGNGWFWNESLIERQSLLIELFLTVLDDTASVQKMQQWLLKQKQTQNWGTTKATSDACYALFLANGLTVEDKFAEKSSVKVALLDTAFTVEDDPSSPTVMKSLSLPQEKQKSEFSIQLTKNGKGQSWGGLYWQYFDDLENIEGSENNIPLYLNKKLYKVVVGDKGEVLVPITSENPIRVGDKISVRVELRADRDFEFVHLKDMRASAFEPTELLSGYRYQDGLYYYQSVRDASMNFFFDRLNKGTYVFEYSVMATQAGTFSNGISTVQCMYAPQFSAHSHGITVNVKM